MKPSVFYEMEFFLLVIFSLVIPAAIYILLYKKLSISRWTVVGFALLLIAIAGIDVVLLQSLAEMAKSSVSAFDEKIFAGQLSLTLYLFPVTFAGLGVNLLSHVLISHLSEAEKEFDESHLSLRAKEAISNPFRDFITPGRFSEQLVLVVASLATAVIFLLDFVTGADIRLHVLYLFPIAMIALHCARLSVIFAALAGTGILQIITFATQAVAMPSFIVDCCVAIAASFLTIFLARTSRSAYLMLSNQATTDSLTRLANHRAFIADLELEIAKQRRYGGSFSLALLDLDGFKALNDSHGHSAGDEALKLVAEILRHCTRLSDSVGRIGGDEFVILMPNMQDVDCGFMFHQLCATIAERMAAAGFAITASIGCKTFNEPPENASVALKQADKIMYEAKRSGKNRAMHL